MRKYKFVCVNNKVTSVLTLYGVWCKFIECLPAIISGTVTFLFGCLCGLLVMLALPGIAVAAALGVIILFPALMACASKEDNVSPALAALLCIVFYVIPFFLMVEKGMFRSFNAIYQLFLDINAWLFMMCTAPMRHIGANVIMFICDIFSDYEVRMSEIMLARDDWSWWVVMSYHMLICAPLLLIMFFGGYAMFIERKTAEARMGLVFRLGFPMGWLFLLIRKDRALL